MLKLGKAVDVDVEEILVEVLPGIMSVVTVVKNADVPPGPELVVSSVVVVATGVAEAFEDVPVLDPDPLPDALLDVKVTVGTVSDPSRAT